MIVGVKIPEILPFSAPLCAPLRFSQAAFSFVSDKRPENIPDPDKVISGQKRLHIEDALRPAKAKDSHICREILMMQTPSLVGGGFSIVRTLKANGAPP